MLRIVVPVLCDARAGESKPEQLIVHSGAQAVDRVGAAGRQVYGSKNRRDIISATAMEWCSSSARANLQSKNGYIEFQRVNSASGDSEGWPSGFAG
jgi:hypothetical protein